MIDSWICSNCGVEVTTWEENGDTFVECYCGVDNLDELRDWMCYEYRRAGDDSSDDSADCVG